MTRTFTGLCVASAFALAASVSAQSGTSSTTASQSSSADKPGHEVSVTGCLARSGDGTYMLTNARVEPATSPTPGGSTASGATTTTGSATTTTGTSGSTASPSSSTSPSASGSMPSDTTWTLQGGRDLDKHVGHRIQVTGNATWASMDHSAAAGAAGSTTGSTASTTASGTAGAATTGTTGTTASGTGTGEQRTGSSSSANRMSNSHPRLDVQSVKMISSSCS